MKKALLWGAALFALFALTGCPKDSDPPEPFTLTVTGIPSLPSGSVMGASLLDKNDISKPIAIGVPVGGNTFTFYYPKSDQNAYPPYDQNKPFNKSGSYWIALAETTLTDLFNPIKTYFYTKNNQKSELSFPPADASLTWNDFTIEP